MVKQALIFRKDLKLSAGKMVVQGAHAAIGAVSLHFEGRQVVLDAWAEEGCTKLTLAAHDEEHLLRLQKQARSRGLLTYLVRDAGRTEIEPGTITCLAIGPGEIDSIIGSLPLWKEEEKDGGNN